MKNQSIDQLISEYQKYMVSREYNKHYMRRKEIDLETLKSFMDERGEDVYTPEICAGFIVYVSGSGKFTNSITLNRVIRTANALLEFANYGYTAVRHNHKVYNYYGEIGSQIEVYIAEREKRFAEATVTSDRLYLERFNEYLKVGNCLTLKELTSEKILDFTGSVSHYSRSTIYCTLSSVRLFLSFLHDKGHIEADLSNIVPKNPYRSGEKLPSLYTKEEVGKLLASVDRKSPMGKRDYAIMLIAAKLGLRASDISGLTFSSINWAENKIFFVQQKTKKPAEFPLLNDVGGAIIDYLKYGRPNSDSRYVFLRTQSPYTELNAGSIYNITKHYFAIAGIQSKEKRKRGPHALRHSLAGRLLENKMPLPVITEVLAHSTPETAQEYLRIDMQTLSQCALSVPVTTFYEGGNA